jgi:hypothetical protein
MTLDTYADLHDSDLDAVADRLDTIAGAAGVPSVSPTAAAGLQAVRRKAATQ